MERKGKKITSTRGRYGNRLPTSWPLLRGTSLDEFSSATVFISVCVMCVSVSMSVCVCVSVWLSERESERKMQIQTV